MKVTNALNIDWTKNWGPSGVPPEFKFAAMNPDGSVVLFTERPVVVDIGDFANYWWDTYNKARGVKHDRVDPSVLKEPLDWRETLTERPVKASL